jgi:prepilin-type N-terminal cleavage/methylation domain-containing protein/prepilin-type processing-associated H-X9-DG protein
MPQKRGFTLVELLVVIGIIAVLIGILLPTLSKARESSRRTACAAQLRDVANLFQMYLNENRQRVPRVNPTPSVPNLVPGAPSIYEVFDRYTKEGRLGWRCPADRIITSPHPTFETYFEKEGGSYEYNPWFNAFAYDEVTGVNKVWRDALKDAEERVRVKPNQLVVFQDFDPFHGKKGEKNARNFLYADWHVEGRVDGSFFGWRPRS